jgi:hypothetical protein
MVQNSGKTLRPGTVKPVNLPEPVQVETTSSGLPAAVRTPRREVIKAIEDRWRIDDEWWRSEEVSRMYYAVLLPAGQKIVIYQDLITSQWYRQVY